MGKKHILSIPQSISSKAALYILQVNISLNWSVLDTELFAILSFQINVFVPLSAYPQISIPCPSLGLVFNLGQIIQRCSLPPKHYSGHSFRIGAATTVATQGLSTAYLQQTGRWSSTAYASHVRPDASAIIKAQRSLKS